MLLMERKYVGVILASAILAFVLAHYNYFQVTPVEGDVFVSTTTTTTTGTPPSDLDDTNKVTITTTTNANANDGTEAKGINGRNKNDESVESSSSSSGSLNDGKDEMDDKNKKNDDNYELNFDIDDRNNDDDDDDDDIPWPRVAWLMSFPNSGTSYTLKLIRVTSNHLTANNYGQSIVDEDGNSVPLHPNYSPQGPFLGHRDKFELPARYILTKTHCGSRCADCGFKGYVETPRTFRKQCLQGKRSIGLGDQKTASNNNTTATNSDGTEFGGSNSNDDSHETSTNEAGTDKEKQDNDNNEDESFIRTNSGKKVPRTIEVSQYDPHLVRKAVHIIRNPFNNIVARYHLSLKHHDLNNATAWTKKEESLGNKFQLHCKKRDANSLYIKEERDSPLLDKPIRALFAKIPCHGDFYKYVQWHNLAFVTTRELGIQSHVLFYEDYARDLNRTVQEILDFLELDRLKEPTPFVVGKEYLNFYTKEQRVAVRDLVKELSSRITWEHLQRYF